MIIYKFRKNNFEEIQIYLITYQGSRYFDVMVFYDASKDDNEKWLPTIKGITISLKLLSKLKEGLNKAIAKI